LAVSVLHFCRGIGAAWGGLASAMAEAKSREAALITFLAASANINLLGIGGAFWGLVIGLFAYAVLNDRFPNYKRAANKELQSYV